MEIGKIDFISKNGWIDESAGRRKFHIHIKENIKEFEKKMLSSGECRHTMPINFLSEENRIMAYYDFTGYIQISDYIKRKLLDYNSAEADHNLVADMLQILYGILECIIGMENYLIFPDRITIHPDVIFIDTMNEKIVFAFYPNVEPELTLQRRIAELLNDLGRLFHSEEADLYLNKVENYVITRNPGLDGMISFIGDMQREVSYIYWNKKDFRKIDEMEPLAGDEKKGKRIKKYNFRPKIAAVHIIILSGLIGVFLMRKLEVANFAGLVIILGALDLLIMKKWK